MAAYGGPKIVVDSLVMYLDAGNPDSYPGTGTAWYDLTRNAVNATAVNSPTYSSSNNGYFVLNGTTQYFTLPATACPNGTNPFSYNVWFNYTALGNFGNYGFLIVDGNASGNFEFTIYGGATSAGPATTVAISVYALGPVTSVSYNFYANTWYNLCLTSTGSAQVFT